MTWFDDDALDSCASCELPLGQPLVCAACHCSLCSSCAVSTSEGEYCPACHADMLAFLADGEVNGAVQVPHDGEVALPLAW